MIHTGLSAHIAPQRGRQDHRNPYNGEPADVVLTHINDLSYLSSVGGIGSPAHTTDKQGNSFPSIDTSPVFVLFYYFK